MPHRSKRNRKRSTSNPKKRSVTRTKRSVKRTKKRSVTRTKRSVTRTKRSVTSPKRSLKSPKRSVTSPKRSVTSPKKRSVTSPNTILHTIGTYNMSFASDSGLDPNRENVYESEGTFLLSNKSNDPRKFWKNALQNVIYFWKGKKYITGHEPSFLGLQEMNKTPVGSSTGSGIVESTLKNIDPNITVVTEEVNSGKSKPALCCIWDSKKLGTLVKSEISEFTYTPIIEAEYASKRTTDKGRPVLMVYTSKGYLLIVVHAPKDDGLALHYLLDFRKDLNDKIVDFSKNLKLTSDKIFIAGDFNDKHDSIQSLDLKIQNQNFTLKYKGTAPKSCCHNWDSSCSQSRYIPLTNLPGRENRTDIGTCKIPTDANGNPYALAGPGKRYVMELEGSISNYRYYDDKVFGADPIDNIKIMANVEHITYNTEKDTVDTYSAESDHEMVVCTFRTKL